MPEEKKTKKLEDFRWLIFTIAIIFLVGALAAAGVSSYQKVHQERIYTSVHLGDIQLSKQTPENAQQILKNSFDSTYSPGFAFKHGDKEVKLENTYEVIQGVERDILKIDYENTAMGAFWVGRSGNAIKDVFTQIAILINAKDIEPVYELDREYLKEKLIENFKEFEDPAQDAKLLVEITSENDKEVEAKILNEKEGIAFDYDAIIDQIEEQIIKFDNETIVLELQKDMPDIRANDATEIPAEVTRLINKHDSILFKYEEDDWEADWGEYATWFGLEKKDKDVALGFNQEKFYEYLEADIEKNINVEAKNARFELFEGKVTEFQASKNGQAVNREETYKLLYEEYFDNDTEIDLVVEEKAPEVTSDNINDMGVRELIGAGESNFSGSPANRRHNIKIGSDTLHGLLIKPGEEFSVVGNLGRIDGTTGYLPELVIRGNKTIPEYGGGLCQVATTMFRTIINTGLPITERRPHSYRVSYYEPAGTDATIYDPSPDLKFVNDTGQYVLIQTFMYGNTLRYEFWGTDDGREVETTDPQIFNITYPGPTKEIVSPDLAPGQRKCTERAHNGADAVFYRTITYASGDVEKETWSSTYRPWQAVCLVGPSAEVADEGDGEPAAEPAE